MNSAKTRFIELMVRCGVLTFGDFVTKSGRRTPFFINAGNFSTGAAMNELADCYAETLHEAMGTGVDCLFGPAYKGIPLAVATAMALSRRYGHEVGILYNRKEAKDHGEGGSLVGWPLRDGAKVAIIEDVTTAGTSVRESIPWLHQKAKVTVCALVVAVDRMERGTGTRSALAELAAAFGLRPLPIVTLAEIVHYLHRRTIDGRVVIDDECKTRIDAYRAEYGAA